MAGWGEGRGDRPYLGDDRSPRDFRRHELSPRRMSPHREEGRGWKRRERDFETHSPPSKWARVDQGWGHDNEPRRHDRHHYDRRDDRGYRRDDREARLYDGPLLPKHQYIFEQILDDRSPEERDEKYEEYKKEHAKREGRRFFDEHMHDEWFKEKYDPEYIKAQMEERLKTCQQAAEKFPAMLERGLDWHLDARDSREEGKPAQDKVTEKESEVEGGEKDSGDAPAQDEEMAGGDDEKAASERPERSERRDYKGKLDDRRLTTVFVKAIPPRITKASLLEVLDNRDEYPLEYFNLAEPKRGKGYDRVGWAHYADEETAQIARTALSAMEIDGYRLIVDLRREQSKVVRHAPPCTAAEKRIESDYEKALELVKTLDKEKNTTCSVIEKLEETYDSVKNRLDILVTYLRHCHLFCYYCGDGFADKEDMRRRCGTVHVRGVPKDEAEVTEEEKEAASSWEKGLDERNQRRIDEPPDFDVPTGVKAQKAAVERFVEENVKKISDDKYRCGVKWCAKLFCGEEYVRKHLNVKHAKDIEDLEKEALDDLFFENYMSDPNRHSHSFAIIPPGPPPGHRGKWGRNRGFGGHYGSRYQPIRPPMTQSERAALPPPPGMEADPREMRQYVDLDAPVEAVPEIDYRSAVSYDDI